MKIIKALCISAACEILCLFIAFTLAGSQMMFMRVLSAVCTTGILVCIMGSNAAKTASADRKQERIQKRSADRITTVLSAVASSALNIMSWAVLYITHSRGEDFYRWHKLLNAPFFQIYNIIEPSASSSSLSGAEISAMLPLSFVPAAVYITAYLLSYKGMLHSD